MTEDTTPAEHVHDWRGRLPHPFEHCCTDNWNQRRMCICGFSEGNRKAHL